MRRWFRSGIGRSLFTRLPWAGPLPEDLLAKDNGEYVASARRIALLLVAVGMLSAQVGCEELQRRAAADLYGYLEKVLVIGEAIAGGIAADGGDGTVRPLPVSAPWERMLAAMAGSAYGTVKVDFDGTGPRFATAGDATGRCPVSVSRVVAADGAEDARVALAVMRPAQWEHMPEQAVGFGNVFLVDLGHPCVPSWQDGRRFLVAKLREQEDDFALVLGDGVYERLEVVWFLYRVKSRMTLQDAEDREAVRSDLFGNFLTTAQLERLDGYAYPFLKASHRAFLQELVLRHASEAKAGFYEPEEWRRAAREMAAAALQPAGLWGFAFERRVAVRVATLVVLALSVSFHYRMRRLNPARDLRDQPWIALLPWGWGEVARASLWALLTGLAVAAVGWALWVYEGGVAELGASLRVKIAEGMEIPWWEQIWLVVSAPLSWGGAAVIAAGWFLSLGWYRVFEVALAARRSRPAQ
ncbi:MAG: hypothetical protein OXQ29_23165 [Rhodospirillaceae bacterium]|nr:hypothetical protein [Rhodospirillaceae bacterium]